MKVHKYNTAEELADFVDRNKDLVEPYYIVFNSNTNQYVLFWTVKHN